MRVALPPVFDSESRMRACCSSLRTRVSLQLQYRLSIGIAAVAKAPGRNGPVPIRVASPKELLHRDLPLVQNISELVQAFGREARHPALRNTAKSTSSEVIRFMYRWIVYNCYIGWC